MTVGYLSGLARRRGISLVEIMVVVVIIGIMASILSASLSSMVSGAEREVQRVTGARLADGAISRAQMTPIAMIDTDTVERTTIQFEDGDQDWAVEYGTEWRVEVESVAGEQYVRITARVFWPAGNSDDPVGEVLRTTMRTP